MGAGLAENIAGYERLARSYDDRHPEIFNEREQHRLREALRTAMAAIRSGNKHALDFGCGSGNLTRHLQVLGFDVVAADVTPAFLRLVRDRLDVPTIELVGGDLSRLPNDAFDLIALYSVLHHIPDYLAAVRQLVRKLKPGGVLCIEHERNRNYYFPPPELQAFRTENHEATRKGGWDPDHVRWQRLLRAAVVPSRHIARYRRLRRMPLEGDIHVYPDDRIEWERVLAVAESAGAELVTRTDFLLFVNGYDVATWQRWRDRCNDQVSLVLRRVAATAFARPNSS